MTVSTRTGEAAYRVLARELRSDILRNRYAGGRQLPTEAELAVLHEVSRQTVRRAFQDLVSEGMVDRIPGRGTFARAPQGTYLRQFGSVEDLMGLSIDTQMQIVSPLRRAVDIDAAGRLRLPTDVVHTLSFRRLHRGTPFCMTTVYLPPDLAGRLSVAPELTEPGLISSVTVIGLLDTRLEHPIAEADQSITVATATPSIAGELGCEVGVPTLRVDRLYFDTHGTAVELGISNFLPEHYSYRVRLHRSGT
jgi:DNA-binding GntR family transcriptional regulator